MNLKNSLLILLFALLISCEKEEPSFQSSGVIIGPDLGFCICCGGYFIEIADSSYHFDTLPNSATIDLENETFPIDVKLNWINERKCGYFQYIKITQIEIKN